LKRRLAVASALLVALALGATRFVTVEIEHSDVPLWDLVSLAAGMTWCSFLPCDPELPPGMTRRLFARELLESVPVAIDVDGRGRVFVAESDRLYGGASDNRRKEYWLPDELAAESVEERRAYIEKWAARGGDPLSWYTERRDVLRVLEDGDGDGVADRSRPLASFGDPLRGLGAGVLALPGGVYYANIPDLFWLPDAEGDGEAPEPEILATGFGVKTSLAGHDLHGLALGPEGRLYFSIGDRGYRVRTREGRELADPLDAGRGAVFRMNPDGSELEVFATGLRNPQELAFDDFGNLFTGDNNSDAADKARVVYLVEGGDSGWTLAFQTLEEEYLRGPWNQERHWELQHPGQPAWILPPIAHLATGPAGLAAYPGLGLPERYRGHLFLCDYRYAITQSGIWSFALRPEGAAFALDDVHLFVGSLLATDLAFGEDGRIAVSEYAERPEPRQALWVLEHGASREDPRLAEAGRWLREGFSARASGELVGLLGHADRRVRSRAQAELAARGEAAALGSLARDRGAPLLARVHALFGLWQQGAAGLRAAGLRDLAWLAAEEPELRAQALRVVGEARADWLAPDLVPFLRDASARVRFFAAQSLGQLAWRPAQAPLFELLRANADADVFLRHAAALALFRLADPEELLARAGDPSPAVRLGVLLALRRARDPRLARFLADPEPGLVVEAARAIYDLRLEAALPALAGLAGGPLPVNDDPETSFALHRRVLAANLRLGTAPAAEALAAYAADPRRPLAMRREALAALGEFSQPGPRDRVLGTWRPLPARDAAHLHPALDRHLPGLLAGELASEAFAVALRTERVPLADAELLARVEGAFGEVAVRVASLRALARRAAAPGSRPVLEAALASALGSWRSDLRAEARELLAELDPGRALAAIESMGWSSRTRERQRAVATLARLGTPAADALLLRRLTELLAGALAPELELDVLEAARARGGPAFREKLAAWERSLDGADPLAPHRPALRGGDALRGRAVFEGRGDCQRCHGVGGRGGGAGPELAEIGGERSREELLLSLVDPQAELAPGFGPLSAMPPMGAALAPGELRDVLEYLASLD